MPLDPKPAVWHHKNRTYLREYLREYRKQRKAAVNRYSRSVLRKVFAVNPKAGDE